VILDKCSLGNRQNTMNKNSSIASGKTSSRPALRLLSADVYIIQSASTSTYTKYAKAPQRALFYPLHAAMYKVGNARIVSADGEKRERFQFVGRWQACRRLSREPYSVERVEVRRARKPVFDGLVEVGVDFHEKDLAGGRLGGVFDSLRA
jgi:hypothetical protein